MPARGAPWLAVAALAFAAACTSPGPTRPAAEDAALGAAPDVPEAAARDFDAAVAAMAAEDWAEAELVLEQLVLEYPRYPGAFVNLAIVYQRDRRWEDAHRALNQALELDPTHSAANNQLGILMRRQGRFAEAEQAYRRAIAGDPNYGIAHYNLGVLLDLYLGRYADALEHYERYQVLTAGENQSVELWIADLQRRTAPSGERLVQDGGAQEERQ